MTTSYKSFFPPAPPAPIENFAYPDAPGGSPKPQNSEMDLLLKAHAEGVREGEEKERVRGAEQLAQERARITEAIHHFHQDVNEYYSRVESEAVQLALAIATKILHREVQLDPNSLVNIARVVLAKIKAETNVRMRVHPTELELWRREFGPRGEGKVAVEVVPDSSVGPQNCVLETDLGSTELGVAVQLKEVEAGLFDLLAQSPGAR